ncbi:MAG: hypothetical protein QOH06_3530 [Acidobacteriota bacterium]|jgi:uncharacterized protein (TIGR03032 family)|nr:hypothetical protein [Acidobacteriota bacterium]
MTRPAPEPRIEITGSRHFLDWLSGLRAGLAVTTYHSNRLFLLGVKRNGSLSVLQRVFERAMGLAAAPDRLVLATRWQLWQFQNALAPGETAGDYDRLFRPHLAWTTGDLDIHDIAFGSDGRPLFVNSLFSCLATVDERHSFRPLWRPPFISKLAPEDRCHLNGLAMEDGQPRYVTAVSRADVPGGWRSLRQAGGIVIDVASGEIVATGLSMPHSPRLYEGRLWLLNSGTGELGTVDLASGRFEPVCFWPGYLRGLAFHGGFAVVGSSRCREERTFSGLPLDERLHERGSEARSGLAVVDLHSGSVSHWLDIGGEVRELYDVQFLPGVRCPSALGVRSKEVWATLTHEEDGRWVRNTGIVEE